MTTATRRGVLLVEVSSTGFIFDGGRLRAAAWLYRRTLGLWAEGDDAPEGLHMAARHAALAVGYDLHAMSGPHLGHRWGIHLHWPRLCLRTAIGRTPAELAARFPPGQDAVALPDDPDLRCAVRRLLVARAAWAWLRSRR